MLATTAYSNDLALTLRSGLLARSTRVHLLAVIVPAIVAVIVALRSSVAVILVEGRSMEPTYQSGSRLLAVRFGKRWLQPTGAVVVGHFDAGQGEADALFVKRLIAKGTSVVRIPLQDLAPLLATRMAARADENGDLTWELGEGEVFVRGDNPSSADSILWGPVSATTVKGVVVGRLASSSLPRRPVRVLA